MNFFSSPKRKTSKAARVKKLANKVAKLKRKKYLNEQEARLKKELEKLR